MLSVVREPRVRVDVLRDEADDRASLYDATLRGLRAEVKELPAVWLYDEHGSRLYEEITRLPEYYLPRREAEILRDRAAVIAKRTQARVLVELGAGTAKNSRLLLDAFAAEGTLERFVPLDVSEQTLRASAQAIAAAYPRVFVHAIVGDFERHLGALPRDGRRLIAFLGSTIGNLYPEQRARFLGTLASMLAGDEAFLVGLDLVKDATRLEAAYSDSRGVTETFVRNALAGLNRELGARFDQRRFAYEARWDPEHEWMDIGLRALQAHTVSIPRLELDVAFEEGEPLRVEISSKFRREQFEREAARARLRVDSWWTDPAGDFAVALVFRDASTVIPFAEIPEGGKEASGEVQRALKRFSRRTQFSNPRTRDKEAGRTSA
jgi:L-histidine N-alpha-methyltransferase